MKKRGNEFIKPNLLKIILTLAIFSLFMFSRIMPCRTAAVIPNPEYTWTFCQANPFLLFYSLYFKGLAGIEIQYLGIHGILGFILAFLISLIISYIVGCFIGSKIKR